MRNRLQSPDAMCDSSPNVNGATQRLFWIRGGVRPVLVSAQGKVYFYISLS